MHIRFQITITFSEDTSMGGAYIGQILSAAEVMQSFNFSQSLGQAFRGVLEVLWTAQSLKCSAPIFFEKSECFS
jgi:hypothetical protein